jgi:hypothetical protein
MGDEVMLAALQALHADVRTIRDNHLAHIAADIEDIKVEQATHGAAIADLQALKSRLMGVVFTLAASALGVGAMAF